MRVGASAQAAGSMGVPGRILHQQRGRVLEMGVCADLVNQCCKYRTPGLLLRLLRRGGMH